MTSSDIIGIGLESSCDETAVSIVLNGRKVLSNVVSSQIDLHRVYYGVVPEIASRAHLEIINDLIDSALLEASVSFSELSYVSVSNRPGLIGSLMVSMQTAKAISYCLNIPLITLSHLEAHLYAPFLENANISFPYIGLLISGGNTSLYLTSNFGENRLLGRTTDDAVGEAYDKIAKFLDLGYPGGPVIDRLAKKAVNKNIVFPLIMTKKEGYRFSYSGLKTAVINYVKANPGADPAEVVYSFQESALEVLVRNVFKAARDNGVKTILVAGGVASNSRLRELLEIGRADDEHIYIPSPSLCTDNAAMVAGLGYRYFLNNRFSNLEAEVFAKEMLA